MIEIVLGFCHLLLNEGVREVNGFGKSEHLARICINVAGFYYKDKSSAELLTYFPVPNIGEQLFVRKDCLH